MSQGREFFEDIAGSFEIIGNPPWASFGTQRMNYGMLGRGGHPIAIAHTVPSVPQTEPVRCGRKPGGDYEAARFHPVSRRHHRFATWFAIPAGMLGITNELIQ